MSRNIGDSITPIQDDNTAQQIQTSSERAIHALHSSQASSSSGSSTYSSSPSSSRQHLSSGNTSPPGTLPTPSTSSALEDRVTSSKLHFSPASRGILQQSLDTDQHSSSDNLSRAAHRAWKGNNSSGSNNSRGEERLADDSRRSRGSVIDNTMHSAPSTSTAGATPSSSLIPFQDNRHHAEAEPANRQSCNVSNNGERPASKARRTSSGGSRVPGEDVGRRSGKAGSSASDSGSDWPHGPKVQAAGPSSRGIDKEANEQVASTSSNYFSSDLSRSGSKRNSGRDDSHPHMELARYPAQDLLRVLAALLAQIATANDHIRPKSSSAAASEDGSSKHKRRDQNNSDQDSRVSATTSSIASAQKSDASETMSRQPSASALSPNRYARPTTAALGSLETPSSTLCFHARNVPSISIESYLLRILKYCPATNEVFLSLLIYFDRMSKMGSSSSLSTQPANTTSELDMPSESDVGQPVLGQDKISVGQEDDDTFAGMRGFAIDSYNVHRLVIAGVTVASKFFSDVFYTNSRYAKVGGLPVHELNQLELQFLFLNDFNLVIPLEEMQRYADQLLVYGGIPNNPWSESAGATRSSDTTPADRSAFGAISHQERKDESMKDF